MASYPSKYPLIDNPYESFMRKHLQHYGYFTGKNESTKRYGVESKAEYKSDSDDADSESVNNSDEEETTIQHKIQLEQKFRSKKNCQVKNANGIKLVNSNKMDSNFKWWLTDQKSVFNVGQQDFDYHREPRWPIEMQVLPERIRHLNIVPLYPEPFYKRSGREETPFYPTPEGRRIVFYYNPLHCGYFVKSRINGSREGCQKAYSDLGDEADSTLLFESRFESGNLMKAVKISETEYLLYLRYDLYTNKHTQWYYFQVKNMKPNITYRFTICNFLKPDSLYNNGMRPLLYSELNAETRNIGWVRCGSDIKYYKNNLKLDENEKNPQQYYSLTWTCSFPNENDTCYFAHCYPYTYTDLQEYVKEIQDDPVRNKFCKIRVLCRSLAENLVHLLTITNPAASMEENRLKKGVVVTARVHPGETNSSWMMKGLLDFLLGSSADAKLLRDNFIFKIIPMLNPDGVVIGNYRCSLTGRDINRNYKTVLKEAFPAAFSAREMVRRFLAEREIVLYCDLHGHSRKNNVFVYGCNNDRDVKNRFKERVFPVILSKNSNDKFSFEACKFKIQKCKEGTGRVVMWNLGILNSFTLEATFSGTTLGSKSGFHFSTKDFESFGYHICDSLLDYCDPDQLKCKEIYDQIEAEFKEKLYRRLKSKGFNVNKDDVDAFNVDMDEISSADEESSDEGSDSSNDDGLPLHLERLLISGRERKKSRKSRKGLRQDSLKERQPSAKNTATTITVLNKPLNNSNINLNAEKDKKEKEHQANKEAEKRSFKQLLNAQLHSQAAAQQQLAIDTRPKSSKPLNNGIPIFTHERAEERAAKKIRNQLISTQSDVEQSMYHTVDQSFVRYSNSGVILHHQNPANLCDGHKKKLSDFLVFRNLSSLDKPNTEAAIQEVSLKTASSIQNFRTTLHVLCGHFKFVGDESDDETECDDTTEYIQASHRGTGGGAGAGSVLKQYSAFQSFVSNYLINTASKCSDRSAQQQTPSVYSKDDTMMLNDTTAQIQLAQNFYNSLKLSTPTKQFTQNGGKFHQQKELCTLSPIITPMANSVTLDSITATATTTVTTMTQKRFSNSKQFYKTPPKSAILHRNSYPLVKVSQAYTFPDTRSHHHHHHQPQTHVKANATTNSGYIASSISFNNSINLKGQFEKPIRPPLMRDKAVK